MRTKSTYKVWESGEKSFRFNALLYGINNGTEDQTAEIHEEDGKLMAYGAYEDGDEFVLQIDHPIYPIRYTKI